MVNTQHHYGIAVGINHYTGFPSLNHAVNDARDFYNWLIDPLGGNLPQKNAALIITPNHLGSNPSEQDARPIKRDIDRVLKRFKNKCFQHNEDHPEDWKHTRLYVFVSGHGIAPNEREAALLVAHAETDEKHNFACESYIEWFQQTQIFSQIIFFADCCRSSATNVINQGPQWDRYRRKNGEMLILRGYATHFGEKAFEEDVTMTANDPNVLRGYFTKALLEALKLGHASSQETHQIDSHQLAKYVTRRVVELTKNRISRQKPYCFYEPVDREIVFRENVKPTEFPITIEFPLGFVGAAKVLYGSKIIRTTQVTNARNPWNIQLPFGLYMVKLSDNANNLYNQETIEVVGSGSHVRFQDN